MQIEIKNANIVGQGGSITNATITGEATITPAPVEPGQPVDPGYGIDVDTGYVRPSHPINLPPTSENPDTFYLLCFVPNPPPPHWEWIAFTPGEDVPERPTQLPPQPPEGEIPTTPGGIKPPPADGGWGYFPGYGWVYYPGASQPSPKRR